MIKQHQRNSATWNLVDGKSVGSQVYEIIRRQIIHGSLLPGIRISEAEVSRNLQTSRQPVREAFIKLRNEGLVEVRPQRGTFVSLISIDAVGDARFIREAVEADIVKLVVQRSSQELITPLRRLIERQRAVAAGELTEFLELDEQFHRSLANLADKGNAWQIIAGTKAHFDRVRYLATTQKPVERLIDQHETLVDSIAAGDAAGAEEAIRSHLREVLADLPRLVRRQPELFVGGTER